MYVEQRLESVETKIDTILNLLRGNGIIGAGAEPAVATQVEAAIAAAGGASGTETPAPTRRGRPRKTAEATATETSQGSGTPGNGVIASAPPAQSDPFATDDAPAQPTRTIDEVRTALLVYTYHNNQDKTLALLKATAGVETLAALKPADYDKVVLAMLPAGKPGINDVKAVLVAAENRKQGSGQDVLEKLGAKDASGKLSIKALPEGKYAEAIAAAHAAGR
jgi:hypothetical protein